MFLRRPRHELLDEEIRAALTSMYATGSRSLGAPFDLVGRVVANLYVLAELMPAAG